MSTVAPEPTPAESKLLGELLEAGLLIETGVAGVYGHGYDFERVRMGLERKVSKDADEIGALRLRFPPLLARRQLESSGYLNSFPHLAGTIFSFEGGEDDAAVQSEHAANHEDWSEFQSMTDVMLTPAACYPVYPAVAQRGPLTGNGVCVDTGAAWVFRHEPSLDPARRQSFRMHELVRIGRPDDVHAWRDEWAERGLEWLRSLGLDANVDNANDPFFGRRGRMLAANQRSQALKLEILVQIASDGPTAIASFNYHQDHFASKYRLVFEDGSAAHTGCLGFGQERITLALLHTHGLDPREWPAEVRAQVWD